MTRVFCDKCGKEVNGYSLENEVVFKDEGENFQHTKESLSLYLSWTYRNSKGLDVQRPDICFECTKRYMVESLKKWGVI